MNTKRESKDAVAKAKNEANIEWYDKTGTEEGERMFYKVAKQRARSRRDIGKVNVITDQIGQILTDEVKIKDRWNEQPTKCRKYQHEEGKSGRMLRPLDIFYQTPRGEWSGHDA